jgi:hypothetical protein
MLRLVYVLLLLSLAVQAKPKTIFVVKEKLDKNRFIIEPLISPRFLVIQDGGIAPKVKTLIHCEASEKKRNIVLDDGKPGVLKSTVIDCGDGVTFEIIGVGLEAQ